MQTSRSEPPAVAATGGRPPALAVSLIPVLNDNYVFVLHDPLAAGAAPGRAVVVDPAVAPPVRAWLESHRLELVAVLQTHHHSDHIGGTAGLLERWPAAAVIAAAADRERIPLQTLSVRGGDRLSLLGRAVEVLEVPGHTRAHLAYVLPAVPGGHGELFCGDTLFAGGCGRLFEGSPEQMHHSLQQLAQLPESTRVWCAHEYTRANLRWAAALVAAEPEAAAGAITARLAAVEQARSQGQATIPSTIALERATNLFLRAGSAATLAALRRHKEGWQG
ncbi:hydroxyacylglutathione hydrolase [Synechococcus sp. ATX 2A4]|uniref:hydroxyacylglutathione hydrolase n=1 Tax=Synechococcus sp. ATX 2A4 TaxID=2823727 RepID=UPI0020CE7AD3|nr:hydroxyacylglutathione hydrolase [Synechococcus sp. ATX 2A4]MCP9885000.1 hydroxyacylglutathione hydrolase [Synechococcus sp. ATX 2A4]